MIKSIISGLGGAAVSALTDFFAKRRAERKLREDLRKLGALEERDAKIRDIADVLAQAGRIRHRIATDPKYRQRVREKFTTPKG